MTTSSSNVLVSPQATIETMQEHLATAESLERELVARAEAIQNLEASLGLGLGAEAIKELEASLPPSKPRAQKSSCHRVAGTPRRC